MTEERLGSAVIVLGGDAPDADGGLGPDTHNRMATGLAVYHRLEDEDKVLAVTGAASAMAVATGEYDSAQKPGYEYMAAYAADHGVPAERIVPVSSYCTFGDILFALQALTDVRAAQTRPSASLQDETLEKFRRPADHLPHNIVLVTSESHATRAYQTAARILGPAAIGEQAATELSTIAAPEAHIPLARRLHELEGSLLMRVIARGLSPAADIPLAERAETIYGRLCKLMPGYSDELSSGRRNANLAGQVVLALASSV
jgi:hypothetical protein